MSPFLRQFLAALSLSLLLSLAWSPVLAGGDDDDAADDDDDSAGGDDDDSAWVGFDPDDVLLGGGCEPTCSQSAAPSSTGWLLGLGLLGLVRLRSRR